MTQEYRPELVANPTNRSALERPFRSEIFTPEALAEHARSIAEDHRLARSWRGTNALYKRFKQNKEILEQCYKSLSLAAQNKEPLSPGADWILDNYHLIEEQVHDIYLDFPRGYYWTLPKLAQGELKNFPRVYHIALEIIIHTDASIDGDLLTTCIRAYQEKSVLASGELWALPIMLRFGLIENLRRLALANTKEAEQRKKEEEILQTILGAESQSGTDIFLALVGKLREDSNLLTTGAAHLIRRLREHGQRTVLTVQWLEERLREHGREPEEEIRVEHNAQAANQISIGNTVTALRRVRSIHWQDWFEGVSEVHKRLLQDPAQVYESCDFATRDNYRHSIERLARSLKKPEEEIAEKVVALARSKKEAAPGDLPVDGKPSGTRRSHIGYYLIDDGQKECESYLLARPSVFRRVGRFLKKHAFVIYSSSILLLTLAFLGRLLWYLHEVGGSVWEGLLVLLFLSIPMSDLASSLVQWFVTRSMRPGLLPKLDFENGVPQRYRTVLAVQAIIHDHEAMQKIVEGLETRFLANDDVNISFALLSDLADSPTEHAPLDNDLISYGEHLVAQLNARHCPDSDSPDSEGRFFLLFRRRLWNPCEGKWMGWERKRGKIAEFNRLLLGDTTTSFRMIVGDAQRLQSIRYVITLDSDSRLPRGVARKLIATLAHPLNEAVYDDKKKRVVEGYGIIQPRVGVDVNSAYASQFANIFSGSAGIDPYTQMVSDVYQDLFQEGSYVGKGIYDVQAFEQALHLQVPENSLLSHDLFEGCFARVALATDIELVDDFPSRYDAYAKRLHRWVRGDWQLLPFIFRSAHNMQGLKQYSPLNALARWKLLDNLRRSLVAPSCFIALILAATLLPGSPLFWFLTILLVLSFPVFANLANALVIPPLGIPVRGYAKGLGRDLLKQFRLTLLVIAFLPYQTFLMCHAIIVTLYRVFLSHKNLLEWQVAYYSERRLDRHARSDFIQMAPGIALTGLFTTLVLVVAPQHLSAFSPLIFLWALSPFFVQWLNTPFPHPNADLSSSEKEHLQTIAWETWNYFDEFLSQEQNYLIPDNVQFAPYQVIAERTSPTNISLSLLSVVSAQDLGFITIPGAVKRLDHIMKSLLKLERCHGHFLNWYQTRSMQALEPKYVSTVDSGNFVGHCIALRAACTEFLNASLIGERHFRHIHHRLQFYITHADSKADGFVTLSKALIANLPRWGKDLHTSILGLRELADFTRQVLLLGDPSHYLPRAFCDAFLRFRREILEISALEPSFRWYHLLEEHSEMLEEALTELSEDTAQNIPQNIRSLAADLRLKCSMQEMSASLLREVLGALEEVFSDLYHQHPNSQKLLPIQEAIQEGMDFLEAFSTGLEDVVQCTDDFIEEIDLGFLYDTDKGVFSIGYHVDTGRKEASYYDLLASEARLASFVAIATQQVPQKHWFALGRSLVNSSQGAALISWSGTMFEYLMPLLVMRDYPGTLLSNTYRSVVLAQQAYGKKKGVPWGISESAYSGVDFEKTYQYRAFGVPALGLKRGLADDLVVSPYSTFLALSIDAKAAMKNIDVLEQQGLRGAFGFYEAIDFTSERLSSEEQSYIVQTFFAHHQGMSLVAITNVLCRESKFGGIMQERFHADPWVRSTDLLLQERFPDPLPAFVAKSREAPTVERLGDDERISKGEMFTSPFSSSPWTRILSNGRYTILLDTAGNGFSRMDRDVALTRWREESTAEQYGTYIYIRDVESGKLWSVAYQPTRKEPESYEVIFNPDKIEFKRRDFGIFLHTEIAVSPEDNVETRRVSISNLSHRTRNLEVTSYAEVALAFARADSAHPAFSKMFIESEYVEDFQGLIFSRRPRSKHEERLYLLHMLTEKTCWQPTQYETSRHRFLGRGNTAHTPAIFSDARPLSGTVGSVLDPIFSLRTYLEIGEGATESIVFTTGFAKSDEDLRVLGQRYHDPHAVTRAFEMAWSHSNIELRHDKLSIRQIHTFQRLGTALLYNIPELRGSTPSLFGNRLIQSHLWRFSISGDLPIVLLRVGDPSQVPLIQEALHAHQYLRMRGLSFDLIILNEYPGGYLQAFQEELEYLVRAQHGGQMENKGGIFLRTRNQLSSEEIGLLEAIARVVLFGTNGSLSAQLKSQKKDLEYPSTRRSLRGSERGSLPSAKDLSPHHHEFANGFGGFVHDGRSYEIRVPARSDTSPALPPKPWSNVIANPTFGFLVTESGAGYTWSENSRENRLTPWSNDAVSDPFGEVLYIRDAEKGEYWSPTPGPLRSSEACRVQHAFGLSQFFKQERSIESCLSISGSSTEPVKWWHVTLTNHSQDERKLEIYLTLDWVLGIQREESNRTLVSNYDAQAAFLYATNHYNNEFAGRIVSLGSSLSISSYTTSRLEFFGQHGDCAAPRIFENSLAPSLSNLLTGLATPVSLSRKVGAGFDSCAVIQAELNLAPGQTREALFYLSENPTLDDARKNASHFRSLTARNAELKNVQETWDKSLAAIQVRTPDRSFDIMMNGWLLYQTLSCRMYGRSGFYQSGGAIGFRDQLQDSMAFLYHEPERVRAQILLHASRQFLEGDVQHWWHPPTGRGVRTRISDDYLWLPYVVHRYIEVTGDRSILDERVSFLDAPQLEPYQMEEYLVPRISERDGTLYEHCTLALRRGLPVGPHGLPLMGGGDWNDGMNEVGKDGRGESVWLAWFLRDCLQKFASIAEDQADHAHAEIFKTHASTLLSAIEESAWDGAWYRRAYSDDGKPLGSTENHDCTIDSLSQSWSVIAGGGSPERSAQAMSSLHQKLIRPKEKIIQLLHPPFDQGPEEPGYIKGYLPGIRENGGQYTHAATWVILATALQGKGREALDLFSMINPINHTSTAEGVARYQAEPYVFCGDVYSSAPHVGQAGWSWYTGSAAWMYQVGLVHILGLQVRSDHFTVNPCVSPDWKEFSFVYHARGVRYEIFVTNPGGVEKGVHSMSVNGKLSESAKVFFLDADANGENKEVVKVHVVMG